jgi:hypothetical protein
MALTAHLKMPEASSGNSLPSRDLRPLHHKFTIPHFTIQIEQDARACSLAPDRVV